MAEQRGGGPSGRGPGERSKGSAGLRLDSGQLVKNGRAGPGTGLSWSLAPGGWRCDKVQALVDKVSVRCLHAAHAQLANGETRGPCSGRRGWDSGRWVH